MERVIVQGAAAQPLIDAVSEHALLVVGSLGRGGFTGVLVGSVSQHCAQHAHLSSRNRPCPDSGRVR